MFVKHQVYRMAALLCVGGLAMTGCVSEDAAEEPEPTQSAPSASATATPDVDLEQFEAALVTDPALVGVAQDPAVEGFVDDPVTMYLTLSEFSRTGQCAALLEELNSFTAPAVGGIAAKFRRDLPAQQPAAEGEESSGAAVETMIFETTEPLEPMAIYREIPGACGTLKSTEVAGAEATFTKIPGLDALLLEISDGEDVETMAVGGSSVNAQFHMYMTAEQVTLEQAEELFGAQAEKLRATFKRDAEQTPAPTAQSTTPTASPTS